MIAAAIAGAIVATITIMVVRAAGVRRARERIDAARVEAAAVVRGAQIEAAAARRAAQTAAREESLEVRAAVEAELTSSVEKLARDEERLDAQAKALADDAAALDQRDEVLAERHNAVKSLRDRAKGLRRDIAKRYEERIQFLEERAGESSDEVIDTLSATWLEDVQANAAHAVRAVDQTSADPHWDESAKRIMEISSERYRNHFLTERNRSNIKVADGVCDKLVDTDGAILHALQEVANIQLHISDDGDAVRLEGLDGVGREVARRALNRLSKRPEKQKEADTDPAAWAAKIRQNLEQEIRSLGKKAFSVLKIQKPHIEIVDLVGALNYRTSYTQNQWLHAVEASFIAGMMASEMGIDIKTARRATLMHDIGKALTHKIDGSHAVIGADIARRLGEDEIIANAIGAHHADEPPNSVYAYLVAAADAMSGARPGARREATDGFNTRVDDLERIGARHRSVDRAHAVHGGRELRVYVREKDIDDVGVVELSTDIAEQVAEEMTFPGQIKVTVIRAFEAVSTAR